MPARAKGAARGSRRKDTVSTAPNPPPPQQPEDPQLSVYSPLQSAVSTIFASAQRTTAGHRKLATNLRNIHEQCVDARGPGAPTGGGRAGEKAFGREFIRNLNKVLLVKKGEVVGDRCLRFCELFVRQAVEKGEILKKKQSESEDDEIPESSPTSRFVISLLKYLVSFLPSKEKAVRYRTAQFLAVLLTNALPTFPVEMDTEVFRKLRDQLGKRMYDKESYVRVHTAVALIRLIEMGVDDIERGDSDDSGDGGIRRGGLIGVIISALQHDSSAEVRRTILYNLSPTQTTLPYFLERTRDVDSTIRLAVFNRLLPSLGDFRHLSINMREKLLRWGLNDRDDTVRAAAGKMFNYRWIEDAKGDLLEVLERMHVVGSSSGDTTNSNSVGGVKEIAMQGFWSVRKDVVESLELDNTFWENLTAESAFLVRSFNDWCRSSKHQGKYESLVEEKLPEVTKLAYHLQIQLNKLIGLVTEDQDTSKVTEEDEVGTDITEQEFIVVQLLMIATSMDYGDEIGRRKMFLLLRNSLSVVELPEAVTKLVVRCLAKLSSGEADFCMLILEVIAELHDRVTEDEDEDGGKKSDGEDEDEDDDYDDAAAQLMQEAGHIPKKAKLTEPEELLKKNSQASLTKSRPDPDVMDVDGLQVGDGENGEESEDEDSKAFKTLVNNIKTLRLAQYMLENVSGSLTQNMSLVSMLNELVVPAVRSHEAIIRELGLRCLGLNCLLNQNLAEENLALFAHCFNKGHEALQVEALRIVSDMLMVHGATLFEGEACGLEQKTFYKLLGKALKLEDSVEVQAAAAEVCCKLMLAQVVKDEDLLKALVIAYFDPLTRDNLSLRQTLSYFLPVYCHSLPENQKRMQEIAVSTLHTLLSISDSLEADEEMVSPTIIATHITDWTDPRKQVTLSTMKQSNPLNTAHGGRFTEAIQNPNIHAHLAADILDRATNSSGCSKEEKKLLLNMLGKLYIPKEVNAELLRGLYDRVALAIEKKAGVDVPSRNLLNRLELTLGKIVAELGEEAEDEDDGGDGAARERGGQGSDMDEDEDEVEVKSEEDEEEMGLALEDIEEVDEDEHGQAEE